MISALEWLWQRENGSSGAIDIVAVKGDSGAMTCSPWHVKVERSTAGLKRAGEMRVLLNGADSGLRMKVGPAGEAFFLVRLDELSSCSGITAHRQRQRSVRISDCKEETSSSFKERDNLSSTSFSSRCCIA